MTLMQLRRLGRERAHELLVLAVLWLLLPVVTLVVGLALADFLCKMLPVWRWLAFGLMLTALSAAVAWLVRFSRRRLSLQAVAALVEKAQPAADNHIINAVQFYEQGNVSAEFIERLLAEPGLRLEQVEARQLYSARSRQWLKRAYPVALFLWALPFLFAPVGMATSLARVFLPFSGIRPHSRTLILEVVPGDLSVKRGQEVEIAARLGGDIPPKATLQLEDETEPPVLLEMTAGEGALFAATTSPLFATTRYRVLAGDASSEWHRLRIAPVPGLVRWEAAVAPPPHTGRQNYLLKHDQEVMEVMAGSTMIFAGLATMRLASIAILQGDQEIALKELDGKEFNVKANLVSEAPVSIKLLSGEGVEAVQPVPLTFKQDAPPAIALVDTPLTSKVERGSEVAIAFAAKDDFGVAKVTLERIPLEAGPTEEVRQAQPETTPALVFNGRFLVDTGSFDLGRDEPLRLRLCAADNNPRQHKAFSALVTIDFLKADEKRENRANTMRQAEDGMAQLIRRQRLNLKDTRQQVDMLSASGDLSLQRLEGITAEQGGIRTAAIALLEDRTALGFVGDILANLVNHEMKEAVELLTSVPRTLPSARGIALQKAVEAENAIIAGLTGLKEGMVAEQDHQEKADIFTVLQKLVKLQRENLKETQEALRGKEIAVNALLHNQDRIAQETLSFSNTCLSQASQRAADEFSAQLRKAHSILSESDAYEMALGASEALEEKDYQSAIDCQKTVLKALLNVLDILNQWRVKNAKETIEAAAAVIHEVGEKLDELEKRQAHIAEVTRDMKARGKLDDEAREKLAEMDKEQKEMADAVEQLANDLYQFPELPVCNELNAKMREVFEDVLQALDSENSPSVEIAVQKEDALLDAIRNTKERIEDVEMWLPDVPDHFVWNMESFDTDEFPEIPLVPLPDELEDLVGELLDQAEDIDAQSQDTTGNNIVADAEMGWAVMDGPMPSFSAKGKSGNTRPNDNEMTGRSGAGREGQATGELVENHVKGYEGRETHARRTQDQFQKGMVTEDEDSTLKARATGGGKLGGESETQGMFGNAPRRDLHTAAHSRQQQKLRQEAEVLYASARLLYIGSGGLGEAARDLRALESAPPDIRELGSLRRRILRRLEDSQVEAKGGTVLPMPVTKVNQAGGVATDDSDTEKLSDEYKPLLNNYYRGLGE